MSIAPKVAKFNLRCLKSSPWPTHRVSTLLFKQRCQHGWADWRKEAVSQSGHPKRPILHHRKANFVLISGLASDTQSSHPASRGADIIKVQLYAREAQAPPLFCDPEAHTLLVLLRVVAKYY
eukprot:1152620-Pelagomonas_calceolata.AAC.2